METFGIKVSSGNEDYYGRCYECKNDLSAYDPGYVASDKDFALCMDCFGDGDTPKLMGAETFGAEGSHTKVKIMTKGGKEKIVKIPAQIPHPFENATINTKNVKNNQLEGYIQDWINENHGVDVYDFKIMNAETFGAEMQITDIDWETDGEDVGLPSTVMVPSDLEEDEIADYLSDNYGWLVNGFVMGAETFEDEGDDMMMKEVRLRIDEEGTQFTPTWAIEKKNIY